MSLQNLSSTLKGYPPFLFEEVTISSYDCLGANSNQTIQPTRHVYAWQLIQMGDNSVAAI